MSLQLQLNRTNSECELALSKGPPLLPIAYSGSAPDGVLAGFRRRIARELCACNYDTIGYQEVVKTDLTSSLTTITSTFAASRVIASPYPNSPIRKPVPITGEPFSLFLLIVTCIGIATALLLRLRPYKNFCGAKIVKKVPLSQLPKSAESTHTYIVTGQDHMSSTSVSGTALLKRRTGKKEGNEMKNALSIWEAAFNNNMNIVQDQIISGMIDINKTHKRYGTPLTAACEGGNFKVARILLDQGADINLVGGRYHVPLQAAAYSGNTNLVKLLLQKKASIAITGGWKGTAIQAASEMSNAATVKLLLQAGADPNLGGGSLLSPLQGAASQGKLEILKILLANGAMVNEEGGEYGSALSAATASGSVEAVSLLLQHGANLSAPPSIYGNCVQIAMRQGFPDLARLLVEAGADGNVVDDLNRTPLIEAVRNGDEVLTRALLKSGVDIDKQDADGYTALHYVAPTGQEAIARMLVTEYGAKVNQFDKFRAPPLHRAAPSGHIGMCKLLIDHGANVNTQDALGATALHQACGIQPAVVAFLLNHGADPNIPTSMGETPLHCAVAGNNVEAINSLLASGCNVNAQDNDQGTPLYRAIGRGYYHIAYLLLRHGVDASIRSSSALQEAITNVRTLDPLPGEESSATISREKILRADLVKALLVAGADYNAQGGQYGSVLQAASILADPDIFADIFLDLGANLNLSGGEYGCALSAACYHGHFPLVKKFLARGANPNQLGGRYGSPIRSVEMGTSDAGIKAALKSLLEEALATTEVDEATGRKLVIHDDDVWRLTLVGYQWLPNENLRDITSAFGHQGKVGKSDCS